MRMLTEAALLQSSRPGRRPRRVELAGVRVSRNAARVYAAVATHSTGSTLSNATLAGLCGISSYSVCESLRELERAQLTKREFLPTGRFIKLLPY